MPASGAQKAEVLVGMPFKDPSELQESGFDLELCTPRIALKKVVTIEGIEGLGGRNTRTLTLNDPAMPKLEMTYLPEIHAVLAKCAAIPGRPGTERVRLIPWANVTNAEPM